MQVLIKILLFKKCYTFFYLREDCFMLPNKDFYKSIGINGVDCCDIDFEQISQHEKRKLKFVANALFLQPFAKECLIFDAYRAKVVRNINQLYGNKQNRTVLLKLILEPPDKEIIDYSWNEKMRLLIWTRIEIENAFSWLSTLGGAYSALGDYFEHCAEEAGRISLRQYKLSKMLGDDGLAERSKLYSAIAHAQKGRLKLARHIVRNIAAFARETHDKRLNRMCQGVWAKLKYLRTIKSTTKIEGDSPNGKGDAHSDNSKLKVQKNV